MNDLFPIKQLNGKISNNEKLSGHLSGENNISGSVSMQKSYPIYDGKYNITPLAYNEQVLMTANKLLKKNIIVDKVPYTETHNESGTTVYIAKEVDN